MLTYRLPREWQIGPAFRTWRKNSNFPVKGITLGPSKKEAFSYREVVKLKMWIHDRGFRSQVRTVQFKGEKVAVKDQFIYAITAQRVTFITSSNIFNAWTFSNIGRARPQKFSWKKPPQKPLRYNPIVQKGEIITECLVLRTHSSCQVVALTPTKTTPRGSYKMVA